MDIAPSLELCRSAFVCAMLIATPLLASALLAGTLVGMVQSFLRLQDSTPTLIARVVVTSGTTIVLLPWLLETLKQFAQTAWGVAPTLLTR